MGMVAKNSVYGKIVRRIHIWHSFFYLTFLEYVLKDFPKNFGNVDKERENFRFGVKNKFGGGNSMKK